MSFRIYNTFISIFLNVSEGLGLPTPAPSRKGMIIAERSSKSCRCHPRFATAHMCGVGTAFVVVAVLTTQCMLLYLLHNHYSFLYEIRIRPNMERLFVKVETF